MTHLLKARFSWQLMIGVAALAALVLVTLLASGSGAGGSVINESSSILVTDLYGKLPMSFEANHGQADSQVKYISHGSGYRLFLSPSEAVLALSKPAADTEDTQAIEQAVVRMKLLGANTQPRVAGLQELPGKVNYFLGKDPDKWVTGIPTYARVEYKEVYPGVNLVYYGSQGQLEYDLIVAPGADPKKITLGFEGVDKLDIDAQGDLVLSTNDGQIRQRKPLIYQDVDGVRHGIAGGYVLEDKYQVGFQVAAYDLTRPLIIDPVVVYSTYLGGSLPEFGFGITVDSSGNAYVTGSTDRTTIGTDADVFVKKLSPDGSALLYSTILGGSVRDFGNSIVVDSSGNAYVTGNADSDNFPTTAGSFQPSTSDGSSRNDVFVTKLDSNGAIVFSTYIGGSGGEFGSGIAVDSTGIYVGGTTNSGRSGTTTFPTTTGAFDTSHNGGTHDAFVTKFTLDLSTLIYSTYLGGSGQDAAGGARKQYPGGGCLPKRLHRGPHCLI